MKILLTWATGFIGKELWKSLLTQGHKLIVVSRNKAKASSIFGSAIQVLTREKINSISLQWIECVIHLAWSSLSDFPRNKTKKAIMRDSRIDTTRFLVNSLPDSCHSFICGSAIGYYPTDPEWEFDIDFINTDPWSFLEQLCVDRESEANRAKTTKRRVVRLRTWIVIWPDKFDRLMRTTTKRIWGVILWSWEQRMSLITRDKRISNCIKIVNNLSIKGPVNMVHTHIRHEEYIINLAKELNRPVRPKIPSWIIKTLLWDASVLMLGSQKITPTTF